jgi:Chitin synthase N-terminal
VELDVPSQLVLTEKGTQESMSCRFVFFNTSNNFIPYGVFRYTGVTCDPDDFESKKYFLRQNIGGRETELAVGITMYNVRDKYAFSHREAHSYVSGRRSFVLPDSLWCNA